MESPEDYARRTLPINFPAERRWQQVQGLLLQPKSSHNPDPLVSIQALDHTGAETTVWMSQQNAAYLLELLNQAAVHGAWPAQMTPAAPTQPHSS